MRKGLGSHQEHRQLFIQRIGKYLRISGVNKSSKNALFIFTNLSIGEELII